MSENTEWLKPVLGCADRACAASNAEEALSCVVATAREMLGARSVAVALIDEESGFLTIRAGQGLSRQFMRSFRRNVGTGLVGEIIWNGRDVILGNVEPESEELRELKLELDLRSVVCVRTALDNRGTGFLLADAAEPDHFRPEHLALLRLLADIAALAVDKDRMQEVNRKLTMMDKPSQVYSYGYFHRRLTEEIERAQRLNERLSLLLLNMDNLKEYRQNNGREAGDRMFKELVGQVKNSMRSIDVLGRYGAEQIVVYLPETNQDAALKAAERIRQMVEKSWEKNGHEPAVTISVGVASLPENGETVNQLMNALASALFKAQRAGVNRVSGPAETYVV